MSFIATIPIGYDLESAMVRFREKYNRDIFIVSSGLFVERDCRYKLPGEAVYIKLSASQQMELYTSGLESTNCIGKDADGNRLFDIRPASILYLGVPGFSAKRLSPPMDLFSPPLDPYWEFKSAPLKTSLLENVPEQWRPYASRHRVRGSVYKFSIGMWVSQAFFRPTQKFLEWQLDGESLVAPGQRAEIRAHENYFGVVDQDPVQCIVCGGTRGERRMFGSWQNTGFGMRYSTPICLGCCEEAFPQWLSLMKGV